MPLVIGEADRAMRICEAALGRGVFAQAIRPPTVPPMTSRLRLAVMASHREAELRDAARTLAAVARAHGFDPRARHDAVFAAQDPGFENDDEEAVAFAREPAGRDPRPAPRRRHARTAAPPSGGVFDFESPEPVRRAA